MQDVTNGVPSLPILALAALAACAPKATPPPPPADTKAVEESTPHTDRDRTGPLGIPEAELPEPGQCRVWYRGRPAAEQPAVQDCRGIEGDAEPPALILYRPPDDTLVVHARVLDPADKGKVLRIDLYDAEKGTYLGTKEP
jgi:hypothetical protein